MIYLVRRSFEADNDKLTHKKELKLAINGQIRDALLPLGIDFEKEELRFNRYGKPYLKNYENIFFNISHCKELAACIVADSEVGIDAENIRPYSLRVAKRVFSDREMELFNNSEKKDETFFRIWTLKESFVKAIGIGISYPMKTCEFVVSEDNVKAYGCDGYSFSQFTLNDEFVCSVCIKKNMNNSFYRVYESKSVFSMELI